jgi:D-tyrosyl-tRNA(Tyr) deacylase
MKAVVTRVRSASVDIAGALVSRIEHGLLVLLGVADGDTEADAAYIAAKVTGLRIFPDESGKMNRSVQDCAGAVLVVSQFTLLGDVRRGRRPSFVAAAAPELANRLYGLVVAAIRDDGLRVSTGVFQADMQVTSVNDGPVTILLDSRDR